ncbi:ribosome recycling factor [Patescibacteria group bacterium]|nr:ribosome recycling factor [Patescibacteria group bacterium]
MNLEIPKDKFEKTIEFLSSELKQVRTGRAHPSLVENLMVEAYDAKTALMQLASISVPEPRQILIQIWDKTIIKQVEKAIQISDLDISPTVDGDLIRLNIPPLNEERRQKLIKIVGQKLEEAKVSIRNEREEIIKNWRAKEKNGEISEDDLFSNQSELQKAVDQYNDKIKEIGEKKKEEILTI